MAKVYTGSGKNFQEVQALPLDEESVREIERRVKAQPHFLGEPLVVIAEARDFPNVVPNAVHDLVALDAVGRAVAVTLVGGIADVDRDLHALQLVSHLGALSADELGKIARSFLSRPANETIRRAWEEFEVEVGDESVELASLLAAVFERDAENYAATLNTEQRILIAAEGFTARFVHVIEWLVRRGVHITGLRYRKYLVGGQEVYFTEQVVPTLNPAVDAPEGRGIVSAEAVEPWRAKGRLWHLERLAPLVGTRLDELLLAIRPATFAINWSNRNYFWIRGSKRNLRVRTYSRDRIEIGFYNASPAALQERIVACGLSAVEVASVGGYLDSPFVALTAETRIDERWTRLFTEWLNGAEGAKPAEA